MPDPSPQAAGTKVPPERELRLCLVMYGGVSLAVYMNGVAREYFDLVRGRGVWGIFKRLADVDAVVDVISGASAGGLNGLFLAYAICGHREFGTMVDLWRNRAGIEALLADPDKPELRSLLKSEYMENELKNAFETMPPVTVGRADELAVSDSPDLDCFMAATNFYGQRVTVGDPTGSPIPTRTHRSTVHFKHRLGRKEPFGAPAVPGVAPPSAAVAKERGTLAPSVLAKVARATSAFPAAFQPIELEGDDLHGRFATDDMDLSPGKTAWYIDGGVLDNKPFTCALPMIYQRHADRPVDRMLFFVEPDPEADEKVTPKEVRAAEPNFLETALASMSSLPSYESILDEIRSIDGHNRKIDLFDAVFGQTEDLDRTEPPKMQWSLYHRSRVHRLMDDVSDELSTEQVAALLSEMNMEAGQSADRAASVHYFRRLFAAKFTGAETPRLAVEQPAVEVDALDVDFVRRAFYFWIYRLYDRLAGQPEDADLRRLISFLSDRIDMLLFLDAQIELALDRLGPAPTFATVVGALTDALSGPAALGAIIAGQEDTTRMLSERRLSGGADTTRFVASYRAPVATAAGSAPSPSASRPLLLPVFLALLDQVIGADATAAFRRFDAWRFPSVYAADLGEIDRIEYYRVSPIDAAAVPGATPELARFRADPMRRLAGRHLAHFGAFLNKAWRSNDVMWGRIDAASVVWDVLLRRRGYQLSRARAVELLAELDAREWASSSSRELVQLHALVAAFAAGKSDEAAFAADLFACHQRAILAEGVPEVIADAARQVQSDPGTSTFGKDVTAAQQLLAAFEESVADPLLRGAAKEAVQALLGDKPEAVLGYVASRYEVGAAGLPELDKQQISVTALQAGRVVTDMFQAVLPRDGLAGSLQRVVSPLALALKTLHLLALSVREGAFPIIWLSLLLAAIATGAAGAIAFQGTAGWPVVAGASVVLGALLLAPQVWFGRGRALRALRWPLLFALPLAAGAGIYWVRRHPLPSPRDHAGVQRWIRHVELIGAAELAWGVLLVFAAAGVWLYARRVRRQARALRASVAAEGLAVRDAAAMMRPRTTAATATAGDPPRASQRGAA
jgi:patatin-related protein